MSSSGGCSIGKDAIGGDLSRRDVVAGTVGLSLAATGAPAVAARKTATKAPLAIAMWDFSWLERRWTGGGYEDWNRALDELAERGYDAVRIDAFPHLMLAGAERRWTLVPVWTEHAWGAPGPVEVTVGPNLIAFIGACRKRRIKVALSSWFREDRTNARMKLAQPEQMAEAWIATLRAVEAADLLDSIVFVDLCNEFPGDLWAPYLQPKQEWGNWPSPVALAYMNKALDGVRSAYPALPLCFSSDRRELSAYLKHDVSRLDLIDHHIWASAANDGEFDRLVGNKYEAFRPDDYVRMAEKGERIYRERPAYWQGLVANKVAALADVSRTLGKPLSTTEGWAVVNYKDWPMLEWGWIKELCEAGVTSATRSGRFMLTCTSNFCGPQHRGMWEDVPWHRRMTRLIKRAPIDPDLRATRLYDRL
jgi:hypothetical protein